MQADNPKIFEAFEALYTQFTPEERNLLAVGLTISELNALDPEALYSASDKIVLPARAVQFLLKHTVRQVDSAGNLNLMCELVERFHHYHLMASMEAGNA